MELAPGLRWDNKPFPQSLYSRDLSRTNPNHEVSFGAFFSFSQPTLSALERNTQKRKFLSSEKAAGKV